jgi:preprotein translocase subunit SecG
MILNIAQLVLSILLTATILMQARGSGAGIAFGGDGNVYRTRRGVEKKLHAATVVIAILFLAVALGNVLFSI